MVTTCCDSTCSIACCYSTCIEESTLQSRKSAFLIRIIMHLSLVDLCIVIQRCDELIRLSYTEVVSRLLVTSRTSPTIYCDRPMGVSV
nr:hypothetical protein Q903MT_gene2564 [Picea sitchensis]